MSNVLTRLSNWSNEHRKLVWLTLFVLITIVIAIVLAPVFLIMPFKAQTTRTLEMSYLMRRWSPVVTVLGSLLILTLTIRLWLGGRWWSRIVLVLLLVPVFAVTWLARQNHFEWMFNPLPNPGYAKASEVTFINDDDRVLSVTLGNEAVAYPIRLMGYHHVVQDTVGGTPIVATY